MRCDSLFEDSGKVHVINILLVNSKYKLRIHVA